MKRCRAVAVAALTWLSCGGALTAQGLAASQAPPPSAEQRGDLAVGYAVMHDIVPLSAGFYASGSWRLSQTTAFVTETQLEHGSRENVPLNLFALQAGLRFSGGSESSPSSRPFGQVLAGVVSGTDILGVALQPGVGVDVGLTPRIALRPQVDGLIFLGGRVAGQTKKDVRFSVGVVFRLYKRG